MRLRFAPSLIAATLVLGIAAPAALGATANQVLADWRADGSIDGDYTLAELRAADAQINEQEREYTFWDDAYADAVRRINDPDAPVRERPPTVPPQDFDKDGDIDTADVTVAKKRTKALRDKLRKCESGNPADRPKDCPKDDDQPVTAEEPEEEIAAASSKDDDGGDGGLGWLAALLFVVPAAVIGFGAWRMQRARKGAPRPTDPDAPMSSFAAGDDLS